MLLPLDAVDSITSSMRELKADHDAIERVRRALLDTLKLIDDDDFTIMGTIQRDSFGVDASATTLSYHHGLAHEVMDATLSALTSDLEALAANLAAAASAVYTADSNSGADLKKRHALIDQLAYRGAHSGASGANDHARNHQRDPFGTSSGSGDR